MTSSRTDVGPDVEQWRVNMAARFFCRNFGVFQLRTTVTRLTWSRFYGHTEPEPLTLRQQSDGIRYRSAAAMLTPAQS